jgi:hypothetical protein
MPVGHQDDHGLCCPNCGGGVFRERFSRERFIGWLVGFFPALLFMPRDTLECTTCRWRFMKDDERLRESPGAEPGQRAERGP